MLFLTKLKNHNAFKLKHCKFLVVSSYSLLNKKLKCFIFAMSVLFLPIISTFKMLSKEQILLKHQRERVKQEYTQANELAEMEGKMLVYPNQKDAAQECLQHFDNGVLLVMIIAQPGTGKTGTALEILHQLSTNKDDAKCVRTDDINIISGMDDTDWRGQFKSKMLPSFQRNVSHRSALNKCKDKIAQIRNGVIMTDECQYASDKNMTVSKVIRAAGLTDVRVVRDRQVRMIEISATPEASSWDIEAWGDKAKIVKIQPGPSYKGFRTMLEEGRIVQAPPLSSIEVVNKMFQMYEDRYQNTTKKYFPMRIQNDDWKGFIRIAIAVFGWEEKTHDSENRIDDIDEIMKTAPAKHTVIFIKGFWRAAKRLTRTHIGGSYETVPKTRNMTSASQGLIARHCDNYEYEGDELNPDLRPIHYGDKASIVAYVNWFEKGCDYRLADYKSTKVRSVNGHVKAKASKLHSTNFTGLDTVFVQNNNPDTHKRIPVIIKLNEEIIRQIREKDTKENPAISKRMINRILQEDSDYAEFLAIISTSPCCQVSTPGLDTVRSYKIHIEDVVDAYTGERKIALMDMKEEFKKKTCWQIYIDQKDHRLCILWQVFLNIEDNEET